MSDNTYLAPGRMNLHRGAVIGAAVAAIVLGAIALFFPGASLLTVAVVFGLSLLVLGLFRVIVAVTATQASRGVRWSTGILGGLILIAALLCLIDPFESLRVLGVVIGIGWIFEGVGGLLAGSAGSGQRRWYPVVAGVVSIVAGIVVIALPVTALAVFVSVAGVILIVLGIVTLAHLPRRAANA